MTVTILDESRKPTPARVYLVDSAGKAQFPAGAIVYDRVRPDGFGAEQHFVPANGWFSVDLPGGVCQLTIERGKEYLPVSEAITIPQSGRVERTVRLTRWVHMARLGWYSADMHVHRPLRDMATLLEAEDLNLGLPITRWRTTPDKLREDEDTLKFLSGRADALGAIRIAGHRWMTVLNEELEPRGSAVLVTRLGRRPAELRYPLVEYGKRSVERGALADVEKGTAWELPVIAALGGCQFVGLANNHFWRTGYYRPGWGAWPDQMIRSYAPACAGYALAGLDMYYVLLNMGFPLKVSAGSANGVHPVPLGWSRLYVKVKGEFRPEKWFEGAAAGRSFATTGPMLFLKVNGLEPGAESRAGRFPLDVTAEIELWSEKPRSSAEVIVNGKAFPVALSAAGRGRVCRGRRELRLTASSWVAARWLDERGAACDVAHTSPIYFWRGHEPIPIPRVEAEYLLKRVEAMIRDLEGGAPGRGLIVADTPDLRQRTLEGLRAAQAVYRKKLEQAQ
ncbi:MAG: CehA/McbA family metallohydrolase [Bryobacteraceae bacterium]